MNEPKVKYKRVDSLVHGEVKEIKLIGEDPEYEKTISIHLSGFNDFIEEWG